MPEPVTELAGRVAAEPLAAWLDQVDFARGQPLAIERLAGGYADEMFRLRRGSRVAVLRRPSGMALAALHEVDWRAAGLRAVAATGEAHT
jgi:hypothetical protein